MKILSKISFGLRHPLVALRYLRRSVKTRGLKPVEPKIKDICLDFRGPWPKVFNLEKLFLNITQNKVIENADKICGHNFGLLGSGTKKLGEKINWHQDFKGGKTWPLKPFYKLSADYGGSDVKIPWELSRFYHLPTLAKAYQLTKNEKYANEFISEVLDWQKQNPLYLGPNWMVAMETGIRAANLIISFCYFESSLSLFPEFKDKFLILIHQHAEYIFNNLENINIKSNHYLGDIVGLFYIGLLMPQLKISQKCLNFAIKALEEEIYNQVYDDGADFESSIPYHRLVTELFAFPAWLCQLNNIRLSDYFWQKLEKMFNFTMAYTKPNSLAPQIGDNDDGRLHLVFEDYYSWEKRNHCHLFILAKELFPKKDWQVPKPESIGFENAGIYLMKSKDFYILANVSPNGQRGNGGHGHNDKLSFELNFHSEDFLIDPGAYIYTPEPGQRNYFRSTQKHNTLRIDNCEQNYIEPKLLFYLKDQSKARVLKWQPGPNQDYLSATHQGYQKLKNPVLHQREFTFQKQYNYLLFKDKLGGKGKHLLEWFFNLAPDINVEVGGEQIFLEKYGKKLILVIPKNLKIDIFDDFVSPSYGVKIPSKTIKISGNFDLALNNEFEFRIRPI